MNSRDIIRVIEKAGWVHCSTTGSHWHFKHSSLPGVVTVPHPKRDLPIDTVKSIEKQSRVRLRK